MVSNYAVSRISSVAKKTIGWAAVALGICLGVCGLAVLDRIWGNSETASGRFDLLAATLFGFTLLFASVIAIRNPRRAGLVLLICSPFAFAAFFLTRIDELRYGMVVWYDWLGSSLLFTSILVVPGLFWLGTHKLNWPPLLLPRESNPLRRKMLWSAGLGLALLGLVWAAAIALAVLARPFSIDCNKISPISTPGPGQVLFAGKVIGTLGACEQYSNRKLCDGAIVVVQEKFRGIRARYALLTQGYFEGGQQYLLDGVRLSGPLTRFLPIIAFRPCNHSAPLKDAQVDLRILRDGSSHSVGVRVIGRVTRYNGRNREPAPGRTVVVTGPAGAITLNTDADGIYDVSGLLPGQYEIHVEPRGSQPPWHTQCGGPRYELVSGAVGGCALQVD